MVFAELFVSDLFIAAGYNLQIVFNITAKWKCWNVYFKYCAALMFAAWCANLTSSDTLLSMAPSMECKAPTENQTCSVMLATKTCSMRNFIVYYLEYKFQTSNFFPPWILEGSEVPFSVFPIQEVPASSAYSPVVICISLHFPASYLTVLFCVKQFRDETQFHSWCNWTAGLTAFILTTDWLFNICIFQSL